MPERVQFQPSVVVVNTPLSPDRTTEVLSIAYSSAGLLIKVASAVGSADVCFPSSIGFRVLDEGDLTEFWSQCSLKTGWIFEVTDGGWKALEFTRAHFVSGMLAEVREFLVIGFDSCVSVMSQEAPQVHVQPAP